MIDLRIGPRTLEMAIALVATVATYCLPHAPLTILADDHRPTSREWLPPTES